VAAAVVRLALSMLLLSAAWHKLRNLGAFRAAIDGYALVPTRFVPFLAGCAVIAEIALGIALLLPPINLLAGCGSASLLAVYTVAIVLNLGRGRSRIDCGCAGPAGSLPLSWSLAVRNAVLIILSLVAALPTAPRTIAVSETVIVVMATSTFALLYVAAETALANGARWRTAIHGQRAHQVSV
jgi:hypothetical protein